MSIDRFNINQWTYCERGDS